MKALAVIDGEYYPPVVRDALSELPYEFVAALLVGGREKLRGGEAYGVPLATSLEQAVAVHAPEVVVDLSDEPVLGPSARFALASRALALGVRYEGADFRLEPPVFAPFDVPSLAVIGTGKRMGKTAVTGHAARLLAREHDLVVVSMGRGGPPEPQVADVSPTVADLLQLSRAGAHAASDYLETAALSRVPTIGCRRAGGGLAGATWTSNVSAGMRKAVERDPELVRVPPGVVERFDVSMVTHKELVRQRRVRVVLDFLVDLLTRHARLLSGRLPRKRREGYGGGVIRRRVKRTTSFGDS